MAKISKRTIDALMARGAPGEVKRDDDVKGFGARLNANGSVSYLVEYRAGRGRGFPVRRIVLGRHGSLTPDQARNFAKNALARVLAGHDPAAERTSKRKEWTVADLLRHVLATHWRVKSKPTTIKNFASTIEHALIPEFGAVRLSELTRSQIRGWHAKQTHRTRQANLDLAILRKALNLAIGDELIKENPASGIQAHPERRRDRIPNDGELAAVLDALDAAAIRPQAALLFKLLLFTGCRTSEWRAAEWGWIDEGTTLRLPDAKAGARPVALSSVVQALLAAAPRTSRRWVVPDDTGEAPLPPSIVSHSWEAFRKAAQVKDLRVHDLRHAFATRGAGLGASAVVLRDALGHKTLQMTSRYISRQNDPVRELAERIGAQLQSIRSGGGDVVRLKRTRAFKGKG
jgi:integrase